MFPGWYFKGHIRGTIWEELWLETGLIGDTVAFLSNDIGGP